MDEMVLKEGKRQIHRCSLMANGIWAGIGHWQRIQQEEVAGTLGILNLQANNRLPAFPEMQGLGLQETNGWQNYRNWETMLSYHTAAEASWVPSKDGVYHTGKDFFERSGGIFEASLHYEGMFKWGPCYIVALR